MIAATASGKILRVNIVVRYIEPGAKHAEKGRNSEPSYDLHLYYVPQPQTTTPLNPACNRINNVDPSHQLCFLYICE